MFSSSVWLSFQLCFEISDPQSRTVRELFQPAHGASELCCKFSTLITLISYFQVNVTVDYIRPASPATDTVPAFSERTCATVTIGGM